jgi:1,4-dihydroxy-2-naphthoate octaprenyltransferase
MSTLVANWREVLATGNLSDGKPIDFVSRWLVLTRASVFPMTLTSGMIGGLLAAGDPRANWAYFALSLLGLVCAHACNNLMNDYFDLEGGVDTASYPRALYAPHPVLSGWISKQGLLGSIALFNAIGAGVLYALWQARGWPAVAFAMAGLFISVFYVAPPIRLKHHGLGEPGVFVVWGPLMIGGTYYVTTGVLPPWVLAASLPYAVLVTTVLIGKHVDKLPHDGPKGIRTLPVILGEERSIRLNRAMMISFYPIVALLALTGMLGPWVLLVFAAVPRLRQTLDVYSKPKPPAPPPRYPIWPLWYVAAAFVHTRRAGGLFILGLLLNWGQSLVL